MARRQARSRRSSASLVLLLLAVVASLGTGCSDDEQVGPTTSVPQASVPHFESLKVTCGQWEDDGSCSQYEFHMPCPTCPSDLRTSLDVGDAARPVPTFDVDKAYVDDLVSDIKNPAFEVHIDPHLERLMKEPEVAAKLDDVMKAAVATRGLTCRRVARVPVCW